MSVIRSRDNARVKRWARLLRDGRFRRDERRVVLEGPHLVAAALEHGLVPVSLIATEAGLAVPEIAALLQKARTPPVVLAAHVFRGMGDAETPQGIAAEIELPQHLAAGRGDAVFLQGVQDAGNVGALIRTSAAFGIGAVVLDRACADAWSPKVLRAGMGGHFGLAIRQVAGLDGELERFEGRIVCTVSRGGMPLREVDLRGPLGWLFGSEGQGVSAQLQERAHLRITIPTAAGTESLNVAAAAAICLNAAFSRPGGGS